MNGVGVFLGPILDGAAGNAVNLKRSEKLPQGGSIPPKEGGLYRWDTAVSGDRVVKEHDHAMDDIRYFAVTVAGRRRDGFFAGTVERGSG